MEARGGHNGYVHDGDRGHKENGRLRAWGTFRHYDDPKFMPSGHTIDTCYSSALAVGITLYAPNMNLVRDPRWGRSQEVYSEVCLAIWLNVVLMIIEHEANLVEPRPDLHASNDRRIHL